jgi:hypothetical protein
VVQEVMADEIRHLLLSLAGDPDAAPHANPLKADGGRADRRES